MVYPERKVNVLKKFLDAFTTYDQVIIVDLNNISTEQITRTRVNLRKEKSIVLIGKNSIVRVAIGILTNKGEVGAEGKVYQKQYPARPDLVNLLPHVEGKIGYVFSHKGYSEIKPIVEREAVKVPAKPGVVAQCDVIVPPQQTNIDPGKIIEFQRIGMNVKTNKSALEIIKEHKLCSKGDIVSETVSAMCRMLGIIPFEYSLKIRKVFVNGSIIPEEVINFDTNKVIALFQQNVSLVAAVSLEAGLPNALSIPHLLVNTFKSLLAVGMEGNVKFKELEEALNSKAAAPAPVAAKDDKKPAKVEKKEEPVEEVVEDVDLGDMFG
jgi:large subunit ribosomal protein LP0